MDAFSGAVLTGGRSTRMGRDKAFVRAGDRSLVAVAAAALLDAGAAEVLAVGGDAEGPRAGALRAEGLRPVPDTSPGAGPLDGIVTALAAAAHDVVVVLACDLPLVEPAAVAEVLAALEAGGAGAAVPVADGRDQVLLAAYRRSCRPALEAALAAGERSPARALAALDVHRFALTEPRWAANANTPRDLDRLTRAR